MGKSSGQFRDLSCTHSGTDHFLYQRITAITNIPLTLFLIWVFAGLIGAPHEEVQLAFQQPARALFTILAIVSVTFHMFLGMQIVIEDYVHRESTKFLMLTANRLFCFFLAVSGIFSILKLCFGG